MTRCLLRAIAAALAIAPALAGADPIPESVYALPDLPQPDQGINDGAVHVDLGVSYYTDYVYRGVEYLETPAHEDSPNLQIDGKLSFDLGKLPHPYVGLFVNVADSDPVSDFQEIRPTVGVDWTIKPLVLSAGYISYLYPERDERQTNEVFAGVALDDKILFKGNPVPVPYVMAAYDFDLYNGVYVEAGVRYRLAFDDVGLTVTPSASVGYVAGYDAFIDGDHGGVDRGYFTSAKNTARNINGLQHYQVGVEGQYSLNKLFNVSTRYGDFSVRGQVAYTDGLTDDAAATTQIWSGVGILLSY